MAKKIWPSSVQIQKLAEDKKLLSNLEKKDLWLSKDKDLRNPTAIIF